MAIRKFIWEDWFARAQTIKAQRGFNNDLMYLFTTLMINCHDTAMKKGAWATEVDWTHSAKILGITTSAVNAWTMERSPARDERWADKVGGALAETLIRIFDYCSAHKIPLGEIFIAKMAYNLRARKGPTT